MNLATTKIQCVSNKRHAVSLNADGTVTCECSDGLARSESIAGRIMLGAPDDTRGCAGLAALVAGAPSLLRLCRGSDRPKFGAWEYLIGAYSGNPVFNAALDLAEKADSTDRKQIRKLMLAAIRSCGYQHTLGVRRFDEEFRPVWDVPTGEMQPSALGVGYMVSCFDDDQWRVPYMQGWKEQIADKGLATIDGKFVCAIDGETVYAIVPSPVYENQWWVLPHRRRGRKLVQVTS